jgi:probable selenium-dependent hydroxylase accessory protein YqeC
VKPLLDYGDVWLIGGGGKTTLMFRLAALWAGSGESALCATTTKIWPPTADQCPDLRVADLAPLVDDLRRRPSPLATVASRIDGGKCLGFSADDTLSLKAHARHLVVEADGSAGRPVKAHAPHEPVIAAGASCVVAVVGAWCVGAPLDAEHVHRPERFAALAGRPLGAAVTAADVARVILHEEGWLRAVPPGAAFHVVVTGAGEEVARALAEHAKAGRLAGVHRG